jgi:hypothetical protein
MQLSYKNKFRRTFLAGLLAGSMLLSACGYEKTQTPTSYSTQPVAAEVTDTPYPVLTPTPTNTPTPTQSPTPTTTTPTPTPDVCLAPPDIDTLYQCLQGESGKYVRDAGCVSDRYCNEPLSYYIENDYPIQWNNGTLRVDADRDGRFDDAGTQIYHLWGRHWQNGYVPWMQSEGMVSIFINTHLDGIRRIDIQIRDPPPCYPSDDFWPGVHVLPGSGDEVCIKYLVGIIDPRIKGEVDFRPATGFALYYDPDMNLFGVWTPGDPDQYQDLIDYWKGLVEKDILPDIIQAREEGELKNPEFNCPPGIQEEAVYHTDHTDGRKIGVRCLNP